MALKASSTDINNLTGLLHREHRHRGQMNGGFTSFRLQRVLWHDHTYGQQDVSAVSYHAFIMRGLVPNASSSLSVFI